MAFVSLKKLRREAIPLLFFGTVVSTKSYFLYRELFVGGGWDRLLTLISHAQDGGGASYLALDTLSYVFYNIVALLFDALVFTSYLIRLEPRNRAKGFWETAFPLATVLLPVTGFTLLTVPGIRAFIPMFNVQDLVHIHYWKPASVVLLHITALLIGAIGATLSFIALWSLKRSFSLMTEVRELVTTGLYRTIRHPLYMAEIIHVFGIAVLSATPVGLWLFVIAAAMQVVRAKIEERKFLRTVPEYAAFKKRTGFLWPGFL